MDIQKFFVFFSFYVHPGDTSRAYYIRTEGSSFSKVPVRYESSGLWKHFMSKKRRKKITKIDKLSNLLYILGSGEQNMNAEIQKDIEIAKQILKKYGGKKLILFGSYADGTADESSDIDLAVDINPEFFFKYYIELEERLDKKVDLILISSLLKKFRERIEKKGVLCVG